MDYATVKSQIGFYAENDETEWVASLPEFIRSAEAEIWMAIQGSRSEYEYEATLSADESEITIPTTNTPQNVKNVRVSETTDTDGPWSFLLIRDKEFLIEAYPSGTSGSPRFYAYPSSAETAAGAKVYDAATRIMIYPPADVDRLVRADYYGFPPSITTRADGESTWLSLTVPDALVYGGLKHGYIAMKGSPEKIATYSQEFGRALTQLQSVLEGRQYSDQTEDGLDKVTQ